MLRERRCSGQLKKRKLEVAGKVGGGGCEKRGFEGLKNRMDAGIFNNVDHLLSFTYFVSMHLKLKRKMQ